jgi:hypothetical protein
MSQPTIPDRNSNNGRAVAEDFFGRDKSCRANPLVGTAWKRAHLLHRNAVTTNLSQSELSCLKANCTPPTQFNFIVAAREEASRALLTRLGCDRLLRSDTRPPDASSLDFKTITPVLAGIGE